jgi:hypothetical protein
MSRITMVHGAGNDLWGPSSIKSKWFPALADGLAWHGTVITEADVRIAFYGDVFRRDPELGYVPPVDEAAAVATVTSAMATADPTVNLDELIKTLAEHHFDRLLAQAAAYIQQPDVRKAAQDRVVEAVDADTRVWWLIRSAPWSPTNPSAPTPNGTSPTSSPSAAPSPPTWCTRGSTRALRMEREYGRVPW